MSNNTTIMRDMEVLRLSNIETNKITKECLRTALILLMKSKNFSDISITELVNLAGVSRTAFYRNYKTKEDILHDYVSEVVNTIYKSMKSNIKIDNSYEYWLQMFIDFTPVSDTFKILINAKFGEIIQNNIFQMLEEEDKKNSVQEKYVNQFWSGAIFCILKQWILDERKETPQEMASICCSILSAKTC